MKMNIVTRIINRIIPEKRSITVSPTSALGLPYGFSETPLSVQVAMQLSVVYRCVECISDAVASQSWEVLEYNDAEGFVDNPFHPTAYMLNFEPNPGYSRFTLLKLMVANMLLNGDAYAEIARDPRGDPVRLSVINENVKTFLRRDGSIYYEVGSPGKTRVVEDVNMIHLLNFTYNGYTGVSTLRHAANSMNLSSAAEASAKGFFSSGANASGMISVKGRLTEEKATKIKQSWIEALDTESGNPSGIIVVEEGLDFKPITINPKDAQMLETRQFNVIDLCRFFGVHPSKVFDQSNLTYSNIESFQLGFLTDTASPLDAKIEAEFNRKLLRPSQRLKTRLNLNIEGLLRANMDARANYVSKMFQCGGYTVNEVRKECRNPKHKSENSDKPMVQINMAPIDALAARQKPVDKKVKLNDNGTE